MTPPILPPARPRITASTAERIVRSVGGDPTFALLGIRGYYRDTMGVRGANDRGLYDDAIVLLSPTNFRAFNANCDPSVARPGIASLELGAWPYTIGTHHPGTPKAYPCLVQAGPVRVRRDGGAVETGEFYIHIHRGSRATTSSEGCQTIPPDQWDEFWENVTREMAVHERPVVTYYLTGTAA
jgi:hypothetical protein